VRFELCLRRAATGKDNDGPLLLFRLRRRQRGPDRTRGRLL